jgi:hypothetical protein
MKQFLLSVSLFVGASAFAQDCSDLFISEYVEGWSNNKALEIYNPTNAPINLSQYMIIRYANGATSVTASNAVQLNGTIQPYSTYVAVIDKRDPAGIGQEAPVWDSLQAKADGFYCPDYNVSNAMYWNGNDVVVLAKGSAANPQNSQAIDIFGKIGEDPDIGGGYNGWTTDFPYVGAGVVVTTDHSMIRKPGVLKGVTNPLISFFNPMEEYDTIPPVVFDADLGYNVGNWFSLGEHACECETLSTGLEFKAKAIIVYPNPSDNGQFTIETESGITEVVVYNGLGQVVYSNTSLAAVATIDLGSKKGVYLVNIRTNEGIVSSNRVIVK